MPVAIKCSSSLPASSGLMASRVRASQPLLRLGSSCCLKRNELLNVRLKKSSRCFQLHTDSDQWDLPSKTGAERQSGRPMSHRRITSVLPQTRHTQIVCRSFCCCIFCNHYIPAIPLACTVHPVSATDARPEASAEAVSSSPAVHAPALHFPSFYPCLSRSSCSPPVSSLPTSPLSFSPNFPPSSQTRSLCSRVLSKLATSPFPPASVPLLVASLPSNVQEAAWELQQTEKKYCFCSAGASVAARLSGRSSCSSKWVSLDKHILCGLTLNPQADSCTPASQGSALPASYVGIVPPESSAPCSPHGSGAISGCRTYPLYCDAAPHMLRCGTKNTSLRVQRITAVAPRIEARAAPCAAAKTAATAPDLGGVRITSTKGFRTSRSSSFQILNGLRWSATGARKLPVLTHLLGGEAADREDICSVDLRKTWGDERLFSKGVREARGPAVTSTQKGLIYSCRIMEKKVLRVSDSSHRLKNVPVAAAAAPVLQERVSIPLKQEPHTSGLVKCVEPQTEASQFWAELHASACGTEEAEMPLSGEGALRVDSADEASYAAVLHAKIKAETAGWAADSTLVNCITDFLLAFKIAVDVPWTIVLPLLGGALRLATLPFAVSSERDIRLRAVYGEEMRALQTAAEKAKASGFASPKFKKAQNKLKTFLKAHNLSLIPLSILQVLLIGLVISLTTPAIRNISGRSDEFPQFATEHPAWVESLAVPDPTPLTALVCTYGMLSLILAGWLVSDKIAKNLPQRRPSSSPFLTRVIPGIVASCVTIYAGVYFPVGTMLLLLPAAGVQAVLTRMFRLRAVERTLNFLPDSLKPLHLLYSDALRYRAPKVFQEWQRELEAKNSTPQEIQSHILLLWRHRMHRNHWSSSRLSRLPGHIKGTKL